MALEIHIDDVERRYRGASAREREWMTDLWDRFAAIVRRQNLLCDAARRLGVEVEKRLLQAMAVKGWALPARSRSPMLMQLAVLGRKLPHELLVGLVESARELARSENRDMLPLVPSHQAVVEQTKVGER